MLEAQSGLFGSSPVDISAPGVLEKLKVCFALAGPIARRLRVRRGGPKKDASAAPAPAADAATAAASPAADGAPATSETPVEAEVTAEPVAPPKPFEFLNTVAAQARALELAHQAAAFIILLSSSCCRCLMIAV